MPTEKRNKINSTNNDIKKELRECEKENEHPENQIDIFMNKYLIIFFFA